MEEPTTTIIYKITTKEQKFVKKFADLLNFSLEHRFNSLFLETIEDGFLFICRDEEFFRRINQKMTPEMVEYVKNFIPTESPHIDAHDIIEERHFPKGGFINTYEAQNDLSVRLMPVFIDYYQNMIPEIKVTRITHDSFDLLYETFESYKFQISLIYPSTITS